jgi:7-cyano-7-deazaguanine synthase
MANIGTKAAVEGKPFKIHTPLIDLKKSDIIKKGISLGIDYSITHSCYDPDALGRACSTCDSCILRRNGFIEAGIPDPTKYI